MLYKLRQIETENRVVQRLLAFGALNLLQSKIICRPLPQDGSMIRLSLGQRSIGIATIEQAE
jgi:hypothetical protein